MSIFKEILWSDINEVIFPGLYECTKFLLLYAEITNQTRQAPFSDASSCSVHYRHIYVRHSKYEKMRSEVRPDPVRCYTRLPPPLPQHTHKET